MRSRAAIRPGDAVTVKGSLSMKMALIVKALKDVTARARRPTR